MAGGGGGWWKKMATGARAGGEPLIGTTALQRGTPPGARGGLQMLVACESHSSCIVDVLSDLLDKDQTEFDNTHHAEASHNFSMILQSVEDQFAHFKNALKKAKADVAEFMASLMLRKPISWRLRRVCQFRWRRKLPAKAVASKWLPSTRLA